LSIENLIEKVTPEIYQSMQSAIETGKWANGVPLTEEQKENCLQIIIAYDAANKNEEERVGYLPTKPKSSPSRNQSVNGDADTQNIRIIED
jgi:uncharacterized protein